MARALVLTAVCGALLVAFAAPAAPAATCSLYASHTGSDRSNGTAAHPFRSAQRLVRALARGGTGCLLGGSVFSGRVVIGKPLTLRGFGAGTATIVGGVTIDRGATGARLQGVTVRGHGDGRAAVLLLADNAQVLGNQISGTGYVNQNTACVLIAGSRGAVVDGNRIETCTRATRRGLAAPGVFVGSAYGGQVTNNLVVHTPGYGIVLGPNAQRTRVIRNLVDGNSGSLLISGNLKTASSYNVVENNIFSNAGGHNVTATWAGVVGRGNAVVSNCLWNGFGGNVSAPGVRLDGNIVTSPRYVDRPRDYSVQATACLAKRPSIVSARISALPAFRVTFHVRALKARVQIVSLGVAGLVHGERLSAICESGCSARWSGVAKGSTAAIGVLHGRWLPVGAVIMVRATLPGRAGAYARATVSGLPNGISVTHGCLTPGGTTPVSCGGFS